MRWRQQKRSKAVQTSTGMPWIPREAEMAEMAEFEIAEFEIER